MIGKKAITPRSDRSIR